MTFDMDFSKMLFTTNVFDSRVVIQIPFIPFIFARRTFSPSQNL